MIAIMTTLTADLKGIVVVCAACGQKNRLLYANLAYETACGKCQTALPRIGVPVEIPSTAVFDAVRTTSALPLLVDFWATWCGPCRMVASQLAVVAEKEAGTALVVKVNTETLPELSARYAIQSIPALKVFKNGTEVASQVGAQPASAIREFLRSGYNRNHERL